MEAAVRLPASDRSVGDWDRFRAASTLQVNILCIEGLMGNIGSSFLAEWLFNNAATQAPPPPHPPSSLCPITLQSLFLWRPNTLTCSGWIKGNQMMLNTIWRPLCLYGSNWFIHKEMVSVSILLRILSSSPCTPRHPPRLVKGRLYAWTTSPLYDTLITINQNS